jgi:argininosuccinate synthase
MVEHIVLAYSGGLDTSVAVGWLVSTYDADVTAVMVDMGQPRQGWKQVQARALANGAEAVHTPDRVDAFAEGYLAPAIQANAVYEDAYPLATALGRPLIARELVQVADEVGADAIAHGCTGKGNDQVRIEASVAALDPDLECLAPQRTDAMTRDEAHAYADEHGLELPPVDEDALYSVDENLWGRSVEGGPLEDPSTPVPEAAYAWTTPPQEAPDEPATVEIGFEHGVPVELDGQPLGLADLVESLNATAGAHGVGRIDHVENRLVGIKSREVYEAPAAETILAAKSALENLALTKTEQRLKAPIEERFTQLVYEARWFEPAVEAIGAFVDEVQVHVTGTVEVQLSKGNVTVQSRQAVDSLYDEVLATYGEGDAFDHEASGGFIDVFSLPLATASQARGPSSVQPEPEVP